MDSPDFEIKYKYIYPFMGVNLYFLLAVMTIQALNRQFSIINLNIFIVILLFAAMLESVIRFNAARKLKVPVFLYLIEAASFLGLLLLLGEGSEGLRDPGTWVVFVVSLIAWVNVQEITSYFNVFYNDSNKIFKNSNSKYSLDEFRRMLDYPSTWKKFSRKISFANIVLIVIWAVVGQFDNFIIIETIIFIICEVFLLSLVYRDKKSIDWHISGIESSLSLKEGWYSFILIILVVSLCFAVVLPYNYDPLPLEEIGNWIQSVLPDIDTREMPDYDSPSGEELVGEPDMPRGDEGPSIVEIVFFVMQSLLFLSILIIVGFLFLFLTKMELSSFRNIPEFFKKFMMFFLNYIRKMFVQIKKVNLSVRSRSRNIRRKRKRDKDKSRETTELKNISLPADMRSMIVIIYNSMLKLLTFKGQGKSKDQTPHEFSRMLKESRSDIGDEMNSITDYYVEIVYSDHSIAESTAELIKSLWKKLRKKL